jgi:hypothetical protein
MVKHSTTLRAEPAPLPLSRCINPATAARAALVVALILAFWFATLPMMSTPDVAPATAPATWFSAERAMAHLRVVAAEPHPMGSPEHQKVVDYIVGQLAALGVEAEVQETIAAKPDYEGEGGFVNAARLQNVIARIPGTDSTGAVLLASHYDSLPMSHNAADGGIGVAAVLETARALRAGPPLRNDVILFFGDGDATMTLGESAFKQHPWFADIRVGFELEATPRGASAIAFAGQGSPDRRGAIVPDLDSTNGWYLREALRVAPHPFVMMALNDFPIHASSLFSIMIGTDIAGVGFVQFGGGEAYHTLLDHPDRVRPGSVQQSVDYFLSLTRHFGGLSLADPKTAPQQVAFSIWPGMTIHYPATWAAPLAGLLVLLFGGTLVVGVRRGAIGPGGLLTGVGLFGLSLAAVLVVTALAWLLAGSINPAYRVHLTRGYYGMDWRLAALVALTVATAAAIYLGAARILPAPRQDRSIAAGALIVPCLLAVAISLTFPTPSYLFLWPALAGVLLLGWSVLFPVQAVRPWPRAGALAVTALVPLVLFTPVLYALFPALAPLGAGTPISPTIALFAVVAVLLGALVPLMQFLGGERRWPVPAAFAALALVGFAGERANSSFSAERPRPNQIQYTLDSATGTAVWQSAATEPDGWTHQFFAAGYSKARDAFSPAYYFEQQFDVIRAPAPALDLPAPRPAVTEDASVDGLRSLRLRLVSPRGAYAAHLDLSLPGELVAVTVAGRAVPVASGSLNDAYVIPAGTRRLPLMVHNLPAEGLEIRITVQGNGPITGTLHDYSNGLPAAPGITVAPRPPEYMPAPYDFRDPTVVRAAIALPGR